ncbi:MAG: class I SAM-dependent methyltransferase family protein [Candidatus Marsarchaeota archaeon]|nr:class I SAM-dependent methyltransferase family protein [Candidatus Marsarchaeota archaeon]
MPYLKVSLSRAESARKKLMDNNLLDRQSEAKHSDSYVYFPISISNAKVNKLIGMGAVVGSIREKTVPNRPRSFREALADIVSSEEEEHVSKGYDIFGNIAIIDISKKLRKKEKAIAMALMAVNPSVKTVVSKDGAVKGKFRKRDYRFVYGERSFMAKYKENNCMFLFDIRKTFFSSRLSFERTRISRLVKPGENVMVMFAGIGPFAIEIAKAHKDSKVIAIELNKYAYGSMVRNIELNKAWNVTPIHGNVKDASRKHRNFADRIAMPMPKESSKFLDEAFIAAKKRAIVHIYAFSPREDPFSIIGAIKKHAKEHNYKVSIIFKRIVRTYSAFEVEVVVDYRIMKR